MRACWAIAVCVGQPARPTGCCGAGGASRDVPDNDRLAADCRRGPTPATFPSAHPSYGVFFRQTARHLRGGRDRVQRQDLLSIRRRGVRARQKRQSVVSGPCVDRQCIHLSTFPPLNVRRAGRRNGPALFCVPGRSRSARAGRSCKKCTHVAATGPDRPPAARMRPSTDRLPVSEALFRTFRCHKRFDGGDQQLSFTIPYKQCGRLNPGARVQLRVHSSCTA